MHNKGTAHWELVFKHSVLSFISFQPKLTFFTQISFNGNKGTPGAVVNTLEIKDTITAAAPHAFQQPKSTVINNHNCELKQNFTYFKILSMDFPILKWLTSTVLWIISAVGWLGFKSATHKQHNPSKDSDSW